MFNILSYIDMLDDPRTGNATIHKFTDIVAIAFIGVFSGMRTWNEIEDLALEREEWLRGFLELPNGIPSHDTINRVCSLINPEKMEECFQLWISDAIQKKREEEQDLQASAGGASECMTPHGWAQNEPAKTTLPEPVDCVSIDGKTVKGAGVRGSESHTHIVSAFSHLNGVVLGQTKVEGKTNEITAIPKLIKMLDLKGKVVTIDSMGCQKAIACDIIEGGGDYVLAVKGNQQGLMEAAMETAMLVKPSSRFEEVDYDHGRIETRKCRVFKDVSMVSGGWNWGGLTALVELESIRHFKNSGKEERETRYFITSLQRPSAKRMIGIIRSHWSVENKLHWCLDVVFGEDWSRKRIRHAAQNFSRILRIALNTLRKDTTSRHANKSLKRKMLAASRDDDYMMFLLTGA